METGKFNDEGPETVAHADLDAFFAAVEQLDNPELRGKPVIVGGENKRGVVSTCSYEARKYGVGSAMSMVTALKLCPEAVVLPVRFERYRELSREVFEVFTSYGKTVEPVSIDEAYIDLSNRSSNAYESRKIAEQIRAAVKNKTGLTCSIGVGNTKLVAKIASAQNKPNGLCVIENRHVREFLLQKDVRAIPGIGPKTEEKLRTVLSVNTVKDLSMVPQGVLVNEFGKKKGQDLFELSHNQDTRRVEPSEENKQIGAENTFVQDLETLHTMERELYVLAGKIEERLQENSKTGRTVTLKVKTNDFKTRTHSRTLPVPVYTRKALHAVLVGLLRKNPPEKPVRLLGGSVSKLEERTAVKSRRESLQMRLFGETLEQVIVGSSVEHKLLGVGRVIDLKNDQAEVEFEKFSPRTVTVALQGLYLKK